MNSKNMSLKQLLKAAVDARPSGIIVGAVRRVNPLEIQAANDSKLILTESNTFVPKWLTNFTVSASASGSTGYESSPESHRHSFSISSITINNGLKAGDSVYLLSFERGQLYYVLDRVEG